MSEIMIGKVIIEMKIADDKQALLFVTDSGDQLIAKVDADCCSHTWIESIELPALGLPFTITAIENLDMSKEDWWDEDEMECVQFYGCKIVTDKGDMVIDYRNSSNGYYGGNLCWPDDDYFYGGVHGQNVSTCNWVDIRDAG